MESTQDIQSIAARFVSIPVSGIDRCDLLCEYFDNQAPVVRIGTQEVQPEGFIKNLTARIVFRSPVQIDPRSLIAKTPRSTSIASRSTQVEIGIMDTTGGLSRHSTGNRVDSIRQFFTPIGHEVQYAVQVPLIFSRFVQPDQMPLVDRIETKGSHVLHYTLNVPGVIWPGLRETVFKIRIKVIQSVPLAEVVSISTNFIDTPRLEEAWRNFKDWVNEGVKKVTSRSTESDAAPPPAVEDASNHHSEDGQHHYQPVPTTGDSTVPLTGSSPSPAKEMIASTSAFPVPPQYSSQDQEMTQQLYLKMIQQYGVPQPNSYPTLVQ